MFDCVFVLGRPGDGGYSGRRNPEWDIYYHFASMYVQSYLDVKYLILVLNYGVGATPTTQTTNNKPQTTINHGALADSHTSAALS